MPKRKPKVFNINHQRTKKQQRKYENISVPLSHLPESLSEMKLFCSNCSSSFQPAWFKKQELPIIPVKPKHENGADYTGPNRWIPTGVSQKCPHCESNVVVDIPSNTMKTKGSLYGDDAHRNYGQKHVFIYTLIGVDQNLLPELNNSVRELKEKICPSKSPKSWSLHMKKLWHGSHREKHDVFKQLNSGDVKNITTDICALIKKQNLFVYNIALSFAAGRKISKRNVAQLKSQAYILLVLNTIDEWTSKKAQPHIFFDAEKSSEANQVIHKWAQDAFIGSQHSLLYGFLAKGIEVPEPKFVKPASHPGLEVADFVSFIIARYYYLKWQGKHFDIDPAEMGLITYLGFDKQGHLLWRRQEGYPWDFFHN